MNTRYGSEVQRVCEVLDAILAKSEWLVGNKCTIADMAFVPWYVTPLYRPVADECRNVIALDNFLTEGKTKADFPHLLKWHAALCENPAIKASLAERDAIMAAPKA